MRAAILAELSEPFSLEALEADKRGNSLEAEHLWDISAELHTRFEKTDRAEARETHR